MTWILTRTKPNQEQWAATNVNRYCDECECYLPHFFDQDADKVRVLFPSYLFVKISNGQFYFLETIFGMAKVIMRGQLPAEIPVRVIDHIKRKERNGLVVLNQPKFRRGDKLRILAGPFINQRAVFDGYKPQRHIRVLLNLLGSSVPITVRSNFVEHGD